MSRDSYYDIDKIFLRGLTVRDIAEPLPSFDYQTPANNVLGAMEANNFHIAGIRQDGFVCRYVEREELGKGTCGQYSHPIEPAKILPGHASLSELVLALNQVPYLFVHFLGEIGGVVTRADLQDPPVRMWLFGLITLIEIRFLTIIERRFQGDEWQEILSQSRLEKATALQAERQRRKQNPSLLECLQFSDKAQIIIRDSQLRQQIGFSSRRRGEEVIKNLEKLRNNLAHAQDIVLLDWETIVGISENLETVIRVGTGKE